MSEEDVLEAISAICECEETSNKWYKKMFKQVAEKPDDWPNWKILGNKLYRFKPDATIELEIEYQEA